MKLDTWFAGFDMAKKVNSANAAAKYSIIQDICFKDTNT